MKMSEYIERELVIRAVKWRFSVPVENLIVEVIGDIPAADAAPVVRCRDCKYHNKPRLGWCSFHMDRENSDDFCSRGEKA